MKVIYPDLINSISVDTEDSDYTVENLYDLHTKSVWKADASNTGSLTCQVKAGSNAIGIFKTNADSLKLRFYSNSINIWESSTRWLNNIQWDQSHTLDVGVEYTPSFVSQWIDYTLQSTNIDVVIDLTAPVGEVLEIGAVVAGYAYSFNDPKPGMNEGRNTTSIIKDLAYGHTYIKNRVQNIRNFSGGFEAVRDSDFYTLMHTIAMQSGATPLAWRLVHSLTNQDWVVLAYITPGGISGTHSYPLDSEMSFSLVEAI